MRDIFEMRGNDLFMEATKVPKAVNILSVQLGSLEYLPVFGIDLDYFMAEDFKVENESFKAYLVRVLAESGINVSEFTDVFDKLSHKYTIKLSPEENTTAMIAR